ncbi:MAG: phosphoribosylaminoimidazolesuccinocarboxamide synthase [Desulfobacterales bacterium]|nr:phosphoribosylaminoimidazolesuccinocarboxamide synthase [Desulfobacterales bacterium]
MGNINQRKHERLETQNLISYSVLDSKSNIVIERGMGRTLNVSEGGILLETHFPIELELMLSLSIGLKDEMISLSGRVIFSRKIGDASYQTGVEFFPPDERSIPVLQRFIKQFETKQPLLQSDFKGLKFLKQGKVRDIYEIGEHLLLVATDRISAFDVVMPNPVPEKGKILTQLSIFWFNVMKDIVENHIVSTNAYDFPAVCEPYKNILDKRSMLVKKAKPIPIECVVRGYISGSGWKSYQEDGTICGIKLPKGLVESDKLEVPIFTPATKEEQGLHDINIDFDETVRRIGKNLAEKLRDLSIAIYKRGVSIAEEKGIIIADTKFEFGLIDDKIILIDEILTPDSSRFWPKDIYKPGSPQDSFDKQYLRDYLSSIKWNKQPPAPNLPEEIIINTRNKYRDALDLITGIDNVF